MTDAENTFSEEDILLTKPAETVGLAATLNDQGLPHISMITSLQAIGPRSMTAGEFCKGLAKEYMERKRKVGFLIMTLDREFWTGKALWQNKENKGPEFEEYNSLPMFRYNSYFGINTVHYLDLISLTKKAPLPMGAIIASALRTRASLPFVSSKQGESILNPFSVNLINKIDSLIFLSFIDDDGFPIVVPAIQAISHRGNSIIFNASPFSQNLKKLKPGAHAAVFCMNLQMESVMLRGTFRGFKKTIFGRTGLIGLDWVYNSMPPSHGQIYPEVKLEAVKSF